RHRRVGDRREDDPHLRGLPLGAHHPRGREAEDRRARAAERHGGRGVGPAVAPLAHQPRREAEARARVSGSAGVSGLGAHADVACPPPQPRRSPMDFEPSPRVRELRGRIAEFMDRHIHPVEPEIAAQADLIRPGVPYPPALLPIRQKARAAGLWNLFLPDEEYGAGLKNWEYGILCELMGRSLAAPVAFNCSAPDTGNIEILAEFGT